MKRGALDTILVCLIAGAMILASCSSVATTSIMTVATTTTTTKITTTTQVTSTTVVPTKVTTSSTSAVTGNWWDKLGKPQYGGTMTFRNNTNVANFDPYYIGGSPSLAGAWMERLFGDDWTLDPSVFAYNIDFRPTDYVKGQLAQSWEFADPTTFVIHLHQGIHWQNLPPVNGREFTADDVVFHYQRMDGLGSGMTPSPNEAGSPILTNVTSVTATDKYTVVFKWKIANPEYILESIEALGGGTNIEAREAVQQWGNLNDWHHAIGTAAFMLQDFVDGSSATLVKNPSYWGYDERYPQNQLPYVDKITYLIIPDNATAIAAFRTGKIDIIDGISLQNAQSVAKTNPEVIQITVPGGTGETIDPRNDRTPFTDIRVREALQMSVDLPTIAKTFYGGIVSPTPLSLTSSYLVGWGYPYSQWPQDLKDQYAYNPTQAKQLLAAAGYPTGFKTDIVTDAADPSLLEIVKSYFTAVGVDMEIRTMDSTSWLAFVRTAHKQDQMVMRSGAGSLGISSDPIHQFMRFQTNYISDTAMVSDPVFDTYYPKAMAATTTDGMKQILIDANKYVAQQHFVISLMLPMNEVLYQPWIYGYNGQSRAISGGTAQPFNISFYGARFWMDQSLKKSLGH